MLRLMVQGDRDAKGIEDAVRELGRICKERGIGLNVGEAGKIVRILAETGAQVRVHQAKAEKPNVPESCTSVGIVNCDEPASSALDNLRRQELVGLGSGITRDRLAWAIRLACLDTSDGFIFFPGREGTLAHLVPIMAFIAKGERDKGVARPRRVALVGWNRDIMDTLGRLFGITIPYNIPFTDMWIIGYEITELATAVTWLTEGLPTA